MLLEILAVVAVGILVYIYLTYYNLSGVYFVRYVKSNCPSCAASKAPWEKIKTEYANAKPEEKANVSATINFVEIDLDNNASLDTLIWRSKYVPSAVEATPEAGVGLIFVYNDEVIPFSGPHNEDTYTTFMFGCLLSKGLIKTFLPPM